MNSMFWNYSHPPLWLQKNRVFQFFYIFRKLYFTKSSFRHFSQFAEDISISRIFPKNYIGMFVDVGCFHPKKYNNTWKLYKRGWTGVNIDIDPIKIKAFELQRTRDHNVSCAIGLHDGEIEYYSNGFYSLTTTTSEEFSNLRKNYIKKNTASRRLDDVLSTSPFSGKQIDFLSIDAEGNDFEVLQSLNFEVYKPVVVAIETQEKFLNKVIETEEFIFLKNKGYDLIAWCGLTLIFANKNFSKNNCISI
jgi:FkbM family methyltransferase